ncbi:cytochrome P450 [Mycena polygramma]|nr:cytochrome P450 [Mycena polygramma]
MTTPIVLVLVPLVLCAAFLFRKVGTREDGLPPGPPTLPILGNLHMFPKNNAHFTYVQFFLFYTTAQNLLKVGPATIVVLTDAMAARELLDRRSATTADRPALHIAERTTGGLHLVVGRSNGRAWKIQRKAAGTVLTPQATIQHLPIQRAEATQLLYNILHAPEARPLSHLLFFMQCSIILTRKPPVLLHRNPTRAPRYEAPEITRFFTILREWNSLLDFGGTPPLDLIPLLQRVPARWAKWKRDSTRLRTLQRAQYFGLLEETRERLRQGEENGSYMEEVLMRQAELGMDDEMAAYFGGSLLEAGSDTTATYLQTLILLLVAHPEVQKKAQEEIDRVVGQHRMPSLDDLEGLPYVRAIILETHRFRPVAPLSVPHATLAAEEYQGYIIPTGTTIFVNEWGIFHDPALYDSPDEFIPERYLLTENGTKPSVDGSALRHNFAFGFGRRACPGIHLAQNSININVMNFLWAFDLNPAIDADGNPVPVDTLAYNTGAAPSPLPFKCRITPRTPDKAKIIEHEFLETAAAFEKFEVGLSAEDREFVKRSRTLGS